MDVVNNDGGVIKMEVNVDEDLTPGPAGSNEKPIVNDPQDTLPDHVQRSGTTEPEAVADDDGADAKDADDNS